VQHQLSAVGQPISKNAEIREFAIVVSTRPFSPCVSISAATNLAGFLQISVLDISQPFNTIPQLAMAYTVDYKSFVRYRL